MRPELASKRRSDGGRHGFGARCPRRRADRNGGEVHLRQRGYGEQPERNGARQRHCDSQQRGRDGSLMKGADIFMTGYSAGTGCSTGAQGFRADAAFRESAAPGGRTKVDDRRRVERQNLAEDQSANIW